MPTSHLINLKLMGILVVYASRSDLRRLRRRLDPWRLENLFYFLFFVGTIEKVFDGEIDVGWSFYNYWTIHAFGRIKQLLRVDFPLNLALDIDLLREGFLLRRLATTLLLYHFLLGGPVFFIRLFKYILDELLHIHFMVR